MRGAGREPGYEGSDFGLFFFFQAEDGIRDVAVTGVQTCALPIFGDPDDAARELRRAVRAGARGGFLLPFTLSGVPHGHPVHDPLWAVAEELDVPIRSEERRVGKECRARRGWYQEEKKT